MSIINGIVSALLFHSEETPDKVFCEEVGGNSISFRSLDNLTCSISKALTENSSLSNGDVISLQFSNSISFIALFISIVRAGYIVNPIPFTTTDEELIEIIKEIGCSMLITEKALSDQFDDFLVQRESPDIKVLLDKYLDTGFQVCNREAVDEISCIFLSSGSSGKAPKGISHVNSTLINTASKFSARVGFSSASRHLVFLPCGNTSFIGHSFIPMLTVGGYLLITKNFLSVMRKVWAIIDQYHIDFVQTVPPIAESMITYYTPVSGNVERRLKFVSCGSAPLSKKTQDEFFDKTSMMLLNIYGLSETGAIFFNSPAENNFDMYSIGTPMTNVDLKLVSVSYRGDVAVGELLVKSDTLFHGYYRNKKLNLNVLDDNGYFRTGDILSFKQGNYYYIGRNDNLIVRAGVNISPEEIEKVIYEFGVNSVIIAKGKDKMGDIVCCVYESIEKNESLQKNISAFCMDRLSPIKIPEIFINIPILPRTANGKIKRFVIKEDFKNEYKI